ncbi:DUF4142 domain-containing protein [Noviherbaspirillum cavernae]|uniref:DUF4142 domain-containing protein n=1 Tax=Noviherbaspirillum cavernae TaxID=2320862 RepID=A0A418WVG6_9BURK|nr:DUF4142 domain-containing protein [Noviherbaspirillum cavernae]RJF96633.1 DUF4142 domain-containing protein [Noviherbaspirillum cavernae]
MKQLSITLAAAVFSLTSAASLAQSAGAPNDAQIAAIVVAANTADINASTLAKSRAQSKEVKGFAEHMVTDHSGSNKQATALVTKLKVKPEESETSKKLKDDGAANVSKLKGMKDAEFDKAYIDNEVTYHQAVLDAMDKTLIPSAKNAELKSLLEKTRPVFDDHLQMAKKIQSSMK